MELKEATRFRERWRFRAREISHTLRVRHADGIARLGALSPLRGHSCDDPWEQDVFHQVANFGRAANFEEVSIRYGAWLDSQNLRTDPSLWHKIVEGNYKLREAIHMKVSDVPSLVRLDTTIVS